MIPRAVLILTTSGAQTDIHLTCSGGQQVATVVNPQSRYLLPHWNQGKIASFAKEIWPLLLRGKIISASEEGLINITDIKLKSMGETVVSILLNSAYWIFSAYLSSRLTRSCRLKNTMGWWNELWMKEYSLYSAEMTLLIAWINQVVMTAWGSNTPSST